MHKRHEAELHREFFFWTALFLSRFMAVSAERVRASEGKKAERGLLRVGLSVLLLAAIAAVVLVLSPLLICTAVPGETLVGRKGPEPCQPPECATGTMSLRKQLLILLRTRPQATLPKSSDARDILATTASSSSPAVSVDQVQGKPCLLLPSVRLIIHTSQERRGVLTVEVNN